MSTSKFGFTLFSRDEFKKYLNDTTFNRVITLIQNHHTWKPDYTHFNGSNHFDLLQNMKTFHMQSNGFSDIAQNLTTFNDGSIALCRPIDVIPAGIKGANSTGICIEHLGNFDIGGSVMTPEHRETIIFVNAALSKKFSLLPDENSIVYHHWYDIITGARTNGTGTVKTCPGTNFFGGNTVENAKANFIPLVIAKLNELRMGGINAGNAASKTGIVITDALNVRSAPSNIAGKIGLLTRGAQVAIFREMDGWYKINKTKENWVSTKFIQVQ